MIETISSIKAAFKHPLPGKPAQYEMAHAFRGPYPKSPENARKAGVLLLLFPDQGKWNVVFIQRPSSKNPDDRHAGQLSFPGGKQEDTDVDMSNTALRETQEEVGVAIEEVTLLGALSELYIPVSNFLVSPFVGYVEKKPIWIPQEEEVAGIIEFPIHRLKSGEITGHTDIKIGSHLRLQQVPFFDLNGKVLWGATAMMMNEFLKMDWS